MRALFNKHFLLISFFLYCISIPAAAQDFEEGLQYFEQEEYEEALAVFSQLDTPEAQLFEGKSYFNLGRYLMAKSALSQITEEAGEEVYPEAVYVSALTDFQLKQFGNALEKLHSLSTSGARNSLVRDGMRFYDDILNYLTLNQRKDAFQNVSEPQIKFDLIHSALGKVDYETAGTLVEQLQKSLSGGFNPSGMMEIRQMLADSLSYATRIAFGPRLQAPEGILYNIGAVLPQYSPGDQEFPISQGLYNGYILAAEEFNQRNANKKAFIRYKDSKGEETNIGHLMTDLAWNYQVDAVLGPLFSEAAKPMAAMAEQYQIPMLAPLANSDTLNLDNPYVYQANPTFSSHGREMARFAVQRLGMDTLAVLGERNSLGAASAFAFRDEAEKLGAKVAYFFVEDLESEGYEVTGYTKYFTSDSTLIDSLNYHRVEGLYAPFTGQAAPTLIDLLLIDLEAMNSDIVVMGSQEWGATQIPENRVEDRTIYFSESYYINSRSDRVEQFNTSYSNRFGIEPNRFAMIGYDAASFLLNTLERVENPVLLKDALRTQPVYQGIIGNIGFGGRHINQQVKIFKISDQGVQPAEY